MSPRRPKASTEDRLPALTEVLRTQLKQSGPILFSQALMEIGFFGLTLPQAKVLGPGDSFRFGPAGAWKGPTLENGCIVYEVVGENGKVYIKHADGKEQEHPPGDKEFYPKGTKVYVCGSVIHLPGTT
jgi:hypothetical protein